MNVRLTPNRTLQSLAVSRRLGVLLASVLLAATSYAEDVTVRLVPQSEGHAPSKVEIAVPADSSGNLRKRIAIVEIARGSSPSVKLPDSVLGAGGVDYRYLVIGGHSSPRQWGNGKVKSDDKGHYLHIAPGPEQ